MGLGSGGSQSRRPSATTDSAHVAAGRAQGQKENVVLVCDGSSGSSVSEETGTSTPPAAGLSTVRQRSCRVPIQHRWSVCNGPMLHICLCLLGEGGCVAFASFVWSNAAGLWTGPALRAPGCHAT